MKLASCVMPLLFLRLSKSFRKSNRKGRIKYLNFGFKGVNNMVDKTFVICPFCKCKHSKTKVLGTSGLVCYNGNEGQSVICDRCGKDFYCDTEIQYKFKTRKNY